MSRARIIGGECLTRGQRAALLLVGEALDNAGKPPPPDPAILAVEEPDESGSRVLACDVVHVAIYLLANGHEHLVPVLRAGAQQARRVPYGVCPVVLIDANGDGAVILVEIKARPGPPPEAGNRAARRTAAAKARRGGPPINSRGGDA